MTEEKKNSKCICCLIIGLVLIVLGLTADVIGIGTGIGFGPKQILIVVAGALILFLGTKPCRFGCCCKKKEAKSE